MAGPEELNFVLWCLCADAVADKLGVSQVQQGSDTLDGAFAKAVGDAAHSKSEGLPNQYEELTRTLFLLVSEWEDDERSAVKQLRARLWKRVRSISDKPPLIEDVRARRALKPCLPHPPEHYRSGAETYYRTVCKDEMAAALREWLVSEERDEARLVNKLAAIWGERRVI